jgi:hypothetical protein
MFWHLDRHVNVSGDRSKFLIGDVELVSFEPTQKEYFLSKNSASYSRVPLAPQGSQTRRSCISSQPQGIPRQGKKEQLPKAFGAPKPSISASEDSLGTSCAKSTARKYGRVATKRCTQQGGCKKRTRQLKKYHL